MYYFTQKIISFAIIVVVFSLFSLAQTTKIPPSKGVTGGDEKPEFNPDSTIIFTPAKPITTFQEALSKLNYAWGANLIFGESGFGGGLFWRKYLSETVTLDVSLNISDARNSDEFETPDYTYQRYLVANKKNRLYSIPLTVNASYFLFKDAIIETLKPFVTVGAGIAFIGQAPYFVYDESNNVVDYKDFFSAIGHIKFSSKMALQIGIGAEVGKVGKPTTQVSINYYYIPFGGVGLESMNYNITGIKPVTQFGGVVLKLAFGIKY